MKRRRFTFALACGAIATLTSAKARGFAEPKLDPRIADLVGEWRITYTNEAVRDYRVDPKGTLFFDGEDRKGPIMKKAEALLVAFGGDSKVERLTMGVDGRLFVEHFTSKEELLSNRPPLMGIGVRQK